MPLVRGICILGIILIHVANGSTQYGQSAPLAHILIFVNCLSRFAVPIFVILSGFYLSLNPKNEQAAPFYRRTLKFLLIPYVSYSILYSMFEFRKTSNAMIIIRDLLIANSHLWFVLLILQLYLIHPVLSRWYRARRHRGIIVICAFLIQISWNLALSILFRAPDLLRSGSPIIARYGALCFISNIGYFLGGYYLLEHANEAVRLFRNRMFVGAGAFCWFSAATGLAALWGIPISQGPAISSTLRTYLTQGLLTPLLSIAALVSFFSFFQNHSFGKTIAYRLLNSLGLYSYGIYYLHVLFLWFVSWIIRRGFMLGNDNPLYFLLLFPFATLLSLVAVRTLSRLPCSRYLT
ncbi:MAG: acyltransferase [Planctomycetes bacterium]|nr:acyltransferase [Planctomycetota bacterium]